MQVGQYVVEQRPKISFEDVQFTRGYRYNCGEIVDNVRVVTLSRARATLEIVTCGFAPLIVQNDPGCRS